MEDRQGLQGGHDRRRSRTRNGGRARRIQSRARATARLALVVFCREVTSRTRLSLSAQVTGLHHWTHDRFGNLGRYVQRRGDVADFGALATTDDIGDSLSQLGVAVSLGLVLLRQTEL